MLQRYYKIEPSEHIDHLHIVSFVDRPWSETVVELVGVEHIEVKLDGLNCCTMRFIFPRKRILPRHCTFSLNSLNGFKHSGLQCKIQSNVGNDWKQMRRGGVDLVETIKGEIQ